MSNWPRVNRHNPEDLRRLTGVVNRVYKPRAQQQQVAEQGAEPVPKEYNSWVEDYVADAVNGGWSEKDAMDNLAAANRQEALDQLMNPELGPTEFVSRGGG